MRHVRHDFYDDPHDWRRVFLQILERTCCVSSACQAARVNRTTAYNHRRRYHEFRRRWDEALQVALERLEVYARERAFNPADPASHILTMFLLKAHRPGVYRDNAHLHPETPKNGAGITDTSVHPEVLARLTPEDLATLEAIARKLAGG